jgi:hypothetical protein
MIGSLIILSLVGMQTLATCLLLAFLVLREDKML